MLVKFILTIDIYRKGSYDRKAGCCGLQKSRINIALPWDIA